jgi:hypothetical protein
MPDTVEGKLLEGLTGCGKSIKPQKLTSGAEPRTRFRRSIGMSKTRALPDLPNSGTSVAKAISEREHLSQR